ncbi:hypothetical protein [Phytoactinopolyspora halophila]|uniref:hypothetical protein n=1 Tax=Phytoactinopolyspora halophila TaxID=1981511 RepID=UPI001FE842D9|nr:hypothetical protein [Phytoactinopolyspora halophila]
MSDRPTASTVMRRRQECEIWLAPEHAGWSDCPGNPAYRLPEEVGMTIVPRLLLDRVMPVRAA